MLISLIFRANDSPCWTMLRLCFKPVLQAMKKAAKYKPFAVFLPSEAGGDLRSGIDLLVQFYGISKDKFNFFPT